MFLQEKEKPRAFEKGYKTDKARIWRYRIIPRVEMSVFTSGEKGSPDIVVEFLEVVFLALGIYDFIIPKLLLFFNEDHCFCSSPISCPAVDEEFALKGRHILA